MDRPRVLNGSSLILSWTRDWVAFETNITDTEHIDPVRCEKLISRPVRSGLVQFLLASFTIYRKDFRTRQKIDSVLCEHSLSQLTVISYTAILSSY